MSITTRQIKLLQLGKTKLGWSEAVWRTTIAELGGVTSVTELDRDGFDLILGFMEWRGFAPMEAKGPDYGKREGFASFAQLELVRTLWREWTRGEGTVEQLNAWLNRTFKITHIRFLTAKDAQKAIGALRKMKARAA